MRYLLIKGVYEVRWNEGIKGKEWRFDVVDGNGNKVVVEVDKGMVGEVKDAMKRAKEKGAAQGKGVE